MKFKYLLAGLAALSLIASTQASTILSENFDDFSSLAGKGWVVKNNSDLPATDRLTKKVISWDQGNPGAAFNSQSGADDSFAGVNFATSNGNVIDDWLFTPVFTISGGGVISFYTRSVDHSLADNMEVRLSSSGASTNTGDFALQFQINPGLDADGYPTDWTQYVITIPDGTAQSTGRLAFRYFLADASTTGNYIGIDSLNVVPEPATMMSLSIGLLALMTMRRRRSGSV
ncbi:choice-of-anchor J domain-containing protein [Undibacterium sp. TJN25]|uniref:choice-of-anchor J domain-containing protein n=1 Tax=Undibacterium sp. TJN25 TaxID=3413056 RepID=UPI003BF0BE02